MSSDGEQHVVVGDRRSACRRGCHHRGRVGRHPRRRAARRFRGHRQDVLRAGGRRRRPDHHGPLSTKPRSPPTPRCPRPSLPAEDLGVRAVVHGDRGCAGSEHEHGDTAERRNPALSPPCCGARHASGDGVSDRHGGPPTSRGRLRDGPCSLPRLVRIGCPPLTFGSAGARKGSGWLPDANARLGAQAAPVNRVEQYVGYGKRAGRRGGRAGAIDRSAPHPRPTGGDHDRQTRAHAGAERRRPAHTAGRGAAWATTSPRSRRPSGPMAASSAWTRPPR